MPEFNRFPVAPRTVAGVLRRLIPALPAVLLALVAGGVQAQTVRPDDAAGNPSRIGPPLVADLVDVLSSDPSERARYEGISVVRVSPANARQLAAALAMAENIWSERVGPGPIELAVRAERVADLAALGLDPVVLVTEVQDLVEAEWSQIQDAERQRGTTFFDTFRQLPEIVGRLNQLATERPDLAQTEIVGQSIQGRDLVAIRITGPGDATNRPRIVWNGGLHAREWIGPMVVSYLADQLIGLYDTDAEIRALVDSVEFVIVPVANPDGYVYSWSSERLWRKNRRGGFGVDLNRNWSSGFGGEGSSGSTSSETYRGTAPFSEPETTALRDLVLAQPNLVGHIDFHAYSQLILRPYGYTFATPPAADNARFIGLGAEMQQTILDAGGVFYENIAASELYIAGGDMSDWAYDEAGAFSYTYELRPASPNPGFILPPEEIMPTCTEILAAMRVYARTVSQPFSLAFESLPTAEIEAGEPTPVSVRASAFAGVIDPATAELRYRAAGEATFTSVPLSDAGGGLFTGSIPPRLCGETLEFYAAALSTGGASVTEPAGGANAPIARPVVQTTVAFIDSVESDLGWTLGVASDDATTGRWERRDPEATAAQPGDDVSDPGTVCFITDGRAGTGLGTYDIDGGRTTLISPRLDATTPGGAAGDATLVYSRWYSNNQGGAPDEDSMLVSISADDGQSWTTLETVSENLNRWERKAFRIADFVTPTSTVRVRFIASDLGSGSVVEAGVDEVAIVFQGCDDGPTADWNGSGSVDVFDILAYLADFNAGNPDADLTGEGQLSVFDILAFLDLFSQATAG